MVEATFPADVVTAAAVIVAVFAVRSKLFCRCVRAMSLLG